MGNEMTSELKYLTIIAFNFTNHSDHYSNLLIALIAPCVQSFT